MKHTVFPVSSLPLTPKKMSGGENVVIFSDWPLTIVHDREGDNRYEKTMFLTLKDVSNFWIQREDVGAVPDGIVEILVFGNDEFTPPSRKPVELWGNHLIEQNISTAGASPITSVISLPGTTYGFLQEISLAASAAGVALNRLDVLDNQGVAGILFSRQQATAQFLLIQPIFPGIKVPNTHQIRFSFTPTVGSSTILLLNYKIGG